MKTKLMVATRNAHKTEEIKAILDPYELEVMDVTSMPELPEIRETGTTFLENARLKALGISALFDGLVLADDSGLEVDALAGAPGVYSSSFGGEEGNHTKNCTHLLTQMKGKELRTARFKCTMVLAFRGKEIGYYEGVVEGSIINEFRGSYGFGYDPLFIPIGYDQTFAELDASVKNQLSHRARALDLVIQYLKHLKLNGYVDMGCEA
jgi:XTP/dITP diphosphohydrolase